MSRPPLPPFDFQSATKKVRMAENAWNTRDPDVVSLAYTPDSRWRNRSEFLKGRDEIREFLRRKWAKELEYRLAKELWSFNANRIAVRFAYEWHDAGGQWFRSYGNENWEFDEEGLMQLRIASINDLAITAEDRKFRWKQGPRPEDHPSLGMLDLSVRTLEARACPKMPPNSRVKCLLPLLSSRSSRPAVRGRPVPARGRAIPGPRISRLICVSSSKAAAVPYSRPRARTGSPK